MGSSRRALGRTGFSGNLFSTNGGPACFVLIGAKEVGRSAPASAPHWSLDVAMNPEPGAKGKVDDLVATYGQVIVDECHHVPAVSFERVLAEVRARYLVGLTATPRAGMASPDQSDAARARPVCSDAKAGGTATVLPPSHRPGHHVQRRRRTRIVRPIQALYAALVQDETRNQLILADVVQSVREKTLSSATHERKDHRVFCNSSRKTCPRRDTFMAAWVHACGKPWRSSSLPRRMRRGSSSRPALPRRGIR